MSQIWYFTPNGNGTSMDGTLPPGAVPCTQAQYANPGAWALQGNAIVAVAPAGPSLAQQAQALAAAGLAITSTATAALNGTYAVDPDTMIYVVSELASIMKNGTFADGTATVEWPDVTGLPHAFSIPQFETLATALGVFVAGIRKCVIGVSGAALPSASATIP